MRVLISRKRRTGWIMRLCKGALLASRDSKKMARKGEEELQDVEGDEEEDVEASWKLGSLFKGAEDVEASWKLGSLFGAADVEESQADSSYDEAWTWNE